MKLKLLLTDSLTPSGGYFDFGYYGCIQFKGVEPILRFKGGKFYIGDKNESRFNKFNAGLKKL